MTAAPTTLTVHPPHIQSTAHTLLQVNLGRMAAEVVDHVIGKHLDLCFGQHLSVIIACRWVSVGPDVRGTPCLGSHGIQMHSSPCLSVWPYSFLQAPPRLLPIGRQGNCSPHADRRLPPPVPCPVLPSVFITFKVFHSPLQFKGLLQEMADEAGRKHAPLLRQLAVSAQPAGRPMEVVFRTVPLCGPDGGVPEGTAAVGDIRTWYNANFLSRMEGACRAMRGVVS